MEKSDASEIYPRKVNAKEVLITPKRWRTYISCGTWYSKIIRNRLRIPRTHSETGVHREERERISAENLTAIGKSFDLKKQKMTKESTRIFGLTQKLGKTFIVIIFNREVQLAGREKNHSSFHKINIIERNSSEKKNTMRGENWRKAKTSEAKQIQLY